jgi:thiamine pyrophosphokinase
MAFGYAPDVVIGDFDSLDPEQRAELQRRGARIETHPRDKDQTDGQLAIEHALQAGADALYLVGFLGGPRLDMAIANVLLLACYAVRMVLLDARNEATLLRDGEVEMWPPEPDEVVSLVALTDARVSTDGLRWPLTNEILRAGESRGVSNEPVSNAVQVAVHTGALLVTRHFAA